MVNREERMANSETASDPTGAEPTEPRMRLPAQAAPVDRRRFRASALAGAAGVEASQLVADPEDLLDVI